MGKTNTETILFGRGRIRRRGSGRGGGGGRGQCRGRHQRGRGRNLRSGRVISTTPSPSPPSTKTTSVPPAISQSAIAAALETFQPRLDTTKSKNTSTATTLTPVQVSQQDNTATNNDDIVTSWTNPAHPGAFRGLNAGAKVLGVPSSKLNEALQEQDAYTLHIAPRRTFPRRKIEAATINSLWQADLADLSKYQTANDGVRYILVCVDAISRKLRLEPMKNKTADASVAAFKAIFERDNALPKQVSFDKGTEFLNKKLKQYCTALGIHLFALPDDIKKAALAERAILTLKLMLYRYLTHNNTHRYIDVLQALSENYNATPHSGIANLAPNDVTPNNVALAKYGHDRRFTPAARRALESRKALIPKLAKGDLVRVSSKKELFSRAGDYNFSEEIFKISRVHKTSPVTYRIREHQRNGQELDGSFYERELQKIRKNFQTAEFYVDTNIGDNGILAHKTANGKKMVQLKFIGDPNPTWVDASTVRDL